MAFAIGPDAEHDADGAANTVGVTYFLGEHHAQIQTPDTLCIAATPA